MLNIARGRSAARSQRDDVYHNVLTYASRITPPPKDSHVVLAVAAPLTAWLDAAESHRDLMYRSAALDRASGNRSDRDYFGSAEELLAAAEPFYLHLVAVCGLDPDEPLDF